MVPIVDSALEHALSPVAVSFSTATVLLVLCALFGSHSVLRWPLLFVCICHITVELTAVALLVLLLKLWAAVVRSLRPDPAMRRLLVKLEAACSWAEYQAAARMLDADLAGTAEWRRDPHHPKYNAVLVSATLQRLRAVRADADANELLDILGTCVRKSFCGVDHEALYARCHAGTKHLVELYVDEVVHSLGDVRQRLGRDAAFDERVRAFLARAQRVYGRTCLALSGGGGLANFSWGTALALHERGLLPSLICGTSAGAVVAAALCTHSDADLDELLRSETLVRLLTSFEEPRSIVLRRALHEGVLYDASRWAPKIQALCNHATIPDITFAEAFKLSGRECACCHRARHRRARPSTGWHAIRRARPWPVPPPHGTCMRTQADKGSRAAPTVLRVRLAPVSRRQAVYHRHRSPPARAASRAVPLG